MSQTTVPNTALDQVQKLSAALQARGVQIGMIHGGQSGDGVKANRRLALRGQVENGQSRLRAHRQQLKDSSQGKERKVPKPFAIVCTDMMSRGMDIDGLTHVINVTPPVDQVSREALDSILFLCSLL